MIKKLLKISMLKNIPFNNKNKRHSTRILNDRHTNHTFSILAKLICGHVGCKSYPELLVKLDTTTSFCNRIKQ